MLSLERLRCLVEVERRGSIGAAANALHITASAVSQQLKALSRSVGVDVIQSMPTGSRCTPAGQILVDHALRAMAELALAEDSLRTLRAQKPRELSMACFPSAVGSLLPGILSRMNHEYPDLRMKFDIMSSTKGLEATISGAVDVALIARYPQDDHLPRDLHHIELGHDALQIIVPREHRLADALVVNLHDLHGEPLLMEGEKSSSCLAFLEACRGASVTPTVKAYSPDAGVSVAMAAEGLGIAVIPRLAITRPPASVVCHILEPPIVRTVVMVTRPATAKLPIVQTLQASALQTWQLTTD